MTGRSPLIAVYIVTFRRHQMLRRAIASVAAQTHAKMVVKVVNDDPADEMVAEIVREFGDNRISLFSPIEKCGPTRNFNLVFEERDADYVSLLEDDNWWEPSFLEEQLRVLKKHPDAPLVVGNQRIWQELPDGSWLDTSQTIWPVSSLQVHNLSVEEICGSARICNSSMLIRVERACELLIPDTIPVDVTEHFRERLLAPDLPINGSPLVNFAVTLQTVRKKDETWGAYQCLLIGSVFAAASRGGATQRLASRLWKDCGSNTSPRAVSLVATGVVFREARALLREAPVWALVRFGIWLTRRPVRLPKLLSIRRRFVDELVFLVTAPLTRHFAESV